MTYAAVDTARQGGRPLELYKFTNGADSWFYCTGEVDQTYLGDVYQAVSIVRGETAASQEFGKSKLRISVPYDNTLARLFATGYPAGITSVTVFRTHQGDGEFITHWRGRVVATSWRDIECELLCEPIFTSLQRPGLRAVFQLQCRHALYSAGCGASKAAFGVSGTISAEVGNQVFVDAAAGLPADFFTAGMLSTPNGSRLIVAHSGSSLLLVTAIPGLTGGMPVTVYPGCDHTLATCESKFANSINFGGQPWLPTKNPFAGDAIV